MGERSNSLAWQPGLQGLRGLAIVLVIAAHSFPGLVPGGWVGVDLFFALSGYLITSLLAAEWRRTGTIDFGAFYRRRARRLLPALALFLPVALVAMTIRQEPAPLAAAAAGAGYVMNLALASGHFAAGQLVAPLWSLSQEEQFYLLWPALLLAVLSWRGPRCTAWLAAGLALASALEGALLAAHGAAPARLYFGPDTHALPLMLGCAAGLGDWRVSRPAALAALGALVALALSLSWTQPIAWRGGSALVALACLALVAGAKSLPLLRARPLQRLGLYSYGLYLWHPLALAVIGRGTAVPLALASALCVSVASFELVEQPLRRMRLAVA